MECPKEELFFFWEIFPTAASISLIFPPFPPHVQLQLAQWSVQPWPWRPAAEGAEREEVPKYGETSEQNCFKKGPRQYWEDKTIQTVALSQKELFYLDFSLLQGDAVSSLTFSTQC